MILKNSWHNAIEVRTSRRTYLKESPGSQILRKIQEVIREINEESGLHFQFIENGNRFLSGFKASYGLISGNPAIIALVGNTADPELKQKIGYFGELSVLECVSHGLGTCWVGGSYDRKECLKTVSLQEGEELICVIAAGKTAQSKNVKEMLVSHLSGGKLSFDQLLTEKDRDLPLWVVSGIEAARKSPSAVNGNPIRYRFQDDRLTVSIAKKNRGAEEIDLGISMAHFQLGAQSQGKEGCWMKKENHYLFL